MFSSPQQTLEALASVGYITDEITGTVVHLAAKLNKPVLLEGPPGSGKTELAYAVAKAISTEVERLQCFEGINEEKAIGRFDEALQRLAVELRSKSGPVEWEQLKQELHGLKFFSAGPLLRALQYRRRCVLLIDELDKVDQAFEAMLLELLSVWQLSIPKLGLMRAETIPFVILTSNEERRIGDPLRRRSFYLRIDHPTPQREAKILRIRTPNQSAEFHQGMADMRRPRETDVTNMLQWEEGFFNSRFTHPSGMGKLTSHSGGFMGLWMELAGKQQFPSRYLIPARHTLQQLVGEAA